MHSGAGGINMHFAYWSPQKLNVKVLLNHIKKHNEKYEKEFYLGLMKTGKNLLE